MIYLFLAAAAASAAPQESPQIPVAKVVSSADDQKALDPERLALARQIVQAFVPPGSIQKMMSSMTNLRSGMMAEMLHATPKELGAKGAKGDNKSLADIMRERDPYFEQRMAITNRVMMEEMGKVMTGFEPQLREAMAKMYAHRFTKTELTDLRTFLMTPSGSSFASQLMSMMSDPEYQAVMRDLTPKIMQALPQIMEKVKKATASLPPPKEGDSAEPAAAPPT
jgi:hypothetical protein